MQRKEIGSSRQSFSHRLHLAWKSDGNAGVERVFIVAGTQVGAFDGKSYCRPHLRGDNLPQFGIGFDEQKMIGRLQLEPMAQPSTHRAERNLQFSGRTK